MKSAIGVNPNFDRRREPRTPMKLDCAFSVNGGKRIAGLTKDLSPSGMAIFARTQVTPGDSVVVLFDEFGRHAGKVVRVFDGGFAIELKRASLALMPFLN